MYFPGCIFSLPASSVCVPVCVCSALHSGKQVLSETGVHDRQRSTQQAAVVRDNCCMRCVPACPHPGFQVPQKTVPPTSPCTCPPKPSLPFFPFRTRKFSVRAQHSWPATEPPLPLTSLTIRTAKACAQAFTKAFAAINKHSVCTRLCKAALCLHPVCTGLVRQCCRTAYAF